MRTCLCLYINLLKMKTKLFLSIALAGIALFSACSGDQTPRKVTKDTVQNTYHAGNANGKGDTSKATSSDMSANGGSQAIKDTGKMKDSTKTR
jgi:hypothetical protein